MPRRFDFISPGVSIVEVDESTIAPEAEEDGILLIGQAPQGPANKPIKVKNLEDFYKVFGKPISGKGSNTTDVWRDGNQQLTTYGMYAAQAWLASGVSPVTFVRLLGADQKASSQNAAYIKAGWNTGHNVSTDAASVNAAYGLFIMPSASVGTTGDSDTSGKLAAIIYASGSALGLKGTLIRSAASREAGGQAGTAMTITGAAGTLIKSDSTSGIKNTFTLVIEDANGTTEKTFHLTRSEKDGYIRNVLNCNPQKVNSTNYGNTESYWLGETFDVAADDATQTSSSAGEQFGILIPLKAGSAKYWPDHEREATAAKTGWFINRNSNPFPDFANYDNNTTSKLFRLISLHEGEWFQNNYGVRIANLRLGTTTLPDSTFSVEIIDAEGTVVERFDNLNLNEASADFIAKRIGDQTQNWNSALEKYETSGEYKNNSDWVRVEMHSDHKAGLADSRALPFGMLGPYKPNDMTFKSGSTSFGSNTLGINSKNDNWAAGHNGHSDHVVQMNMPSLTASVSWPDIKLTEANTSTGNFDKKYAFGVRHMLVSDNQDKKTLWYSPDYKDLVRALPGGLDIHGDTASDYLKLSWIFSLDDIRQDVNDSSRFYYESGSHKAGNAATAKSGGTNNILSGGVKQFNAPFFGGSDGLDITIVDNFSITSGLASTQDESKHFAYYSVKRALDVVSDKELLEYDIISMPGLLNSGLALDLIRVAEDRGDALAIIDLDSGYRKPFENNGTEILGQSGVGGSKQAILDAQSRDLNTSYAATYYPPVRIRDVVGGRQDVTIVHPSVAALGAIASSEANSDGPWFAPAGFNRGGISVLGGSAGPRVVGTIEHLTKQDRDDLYEENINPIARFPAVGEIVIFGQKTMQQTQSALDRINVRRLMIYLKKRIGKIANTILFDQNVRSTWLRFKAQAERVLSDVKSRFGITEYKLVLDETTTTADLVDRNILYAKVFIKPARSIEFIAIDFVITKTGIEL